MVLHLHSLPLYISHISLKLKKRDCFKSKIAQIHIYIMQRTKEHFSFALRRVSNQSFPSNLLYYQFNHLLTIEILRNSNVIICEVSLKLQIF